QLQWRAERLGCGRRVQSRARQDLDWRQSVATGSEEGDARRLSASSSHVSMPDFWRSCGYRLLVVGSDGRVTLTDDFLRAHLLRPELAPIPESSAAELALHDALIDDPRRTVSERELDAIDDADARDNYRIWLKLRARLLNAASVEAAYAGLFHGDVDVPPLFVQQLTQVIVRHILGADADPLEARAGEMLFRPQ